MTTQWYYSLLEYLCPYSWHDFTQLADSALPLALLVSMLVDSCQIQKYSLGKERVRPQETTATTFPSQLENMKKVASSMVEKYERRAYVQSEWSGKHARASYFINEILCIYSSSTHSRIRIDPCIMVHRYEVRKQFANSRMRVKGRFVKKEDEELLRDALGLA